LVLENLEATNLILLETTVDKTVTCLEF